MKKQYQKEKEKMTMAVFDDLYFQVM